MLKGPYADWREAVADCCVKRRLMIVQHDWKDSKLYVATVPYPEPQPRFANRR